MLEHLHIKNFILIEEADIEFDDHLNILTGETGAGKSILLGSMNLALGGRMSKEMIRSGAEEALVELVFFEDRKGILEKLQKLEICPEDGKIIISRRCSVTGRTSARVNGSPVTLSVLRTLGSLLLDLHSQHENQSLMDKAKHLELLDQYGQNEEQAWKRSLESVYDEYVSVCAKIQELTISEEQRLREKAFLAYEMQEIEDAHMKQGEEEELERAYKTAKNSSNLLEGLGTILGMLDDGSAMDAFSGQSAGELLGQSLRIMHQMQKYDENLSELAEQLEELEMLFRQFTTDVSRYIDTLFCDPSQLNEMEQRLDHIRSVKARYGATVEDIEKYYQKIKEKHSQYEAYDITMQSLQKQKKTLEITLEDLCSQLSCARKKTAETLSGQVIEALQELNFLEVKFYTKFHRLNHFTRNGFDEAEFMISTNPGQECRPLGKTASGGELSRIMLAVKSVMADKDEIGTLVFDEIDTGISGRTAQRVSEKLAEIAKQHQVFCVTHLPQIAAMADRHFKIEKFTDGVITTTAIQPMDEQASVEELARMLGGAKITKAVLHSAAEMRMLAKHQKAYGRNCDGKTV